MTGSGETLQENEMISWAAYHADSLVRHQVVSCLSYRYYHYFVVAMIRHAMDVVKAAIGVVNPGQVPILACDQPLYAIAKQIQWSWPSIYGEGHYNHDVWWITF